MSASKIALVGILVVAAAALVAADAQAFRMIQVSSWPGTYSAGARVTCGNWFGFAHWDQERDWWYLNTQGQGSGKTTAIRNSLNAWTNVTQADYRLSWGGTTGRGLNGNDRRNVLIWRNDPGLCGAGCLAITILTVNWGQVITDVDIMFDNNDTWTTNGNNFDTQTVAAHELGHGMGIHHTELGGGTATRPTMAAAYFGSRGRSLQFDDRQALRCAFDRYPPSQPFQDDQEEAEATLSATGSGAFGTLAGAAAAGAPASGGLQLATRPMRGGVVVRYALDEAADVQLHVYDVAGRKVATLVDAGRGAGEHEVAWNGATTAGSAASGVYFARLVTPGDSVDAKLFLMR